MTTYDNRQFYIDGAWVNPAEPKELKVINPATEEVAGVISMGSGKDVDRAVMAARRAFDSYSRTTPAERLALMERILAAYKAHYDEIAQAMTTEMGAPMTLSKGSQTRIGVGHISAMIDVLKTFKFENARLFVCGSQSAFVRDIAWKWYQVAVGCAGTGLPATPWLALQRRHPGVGRSRHPLGVFNLINEGWPGHRVRRCHRTGRSRYGLLHGVHAGGYLKVAALRHQGWAAKSPRSCWMTPTSAANVLGMGIPDNHGVCRRQRRGIPSRMINGRRTSDRWCRS